MKKLERIPLHDHIDNNSGGRISRGQIVEAVGGGGGGGGGEAPPGSGSDGEAAFDHGNMGSTETLNLADGTWHRGTLNADCTITVTGFTVDEGLVVVFEVTQDGTGGWAITWDADVQFIGDDQPDQTAGSVTVFLLFSSAGDSTIYGAKVGASGGTTATDANIWRPLMSGGAVITDGSGQAVMAWGPA